MGELTKKIKQTVKGAKDTVIGEDTDKTGTSATRDTLTEYESSEPMTPAKIDNQQTDSNGKFAATSKAPTSSGTASITAVFDGNGLYHAGTSDSALVIISNTTLPS
jgi:hypothetical protein